VYYCKHKPKVKTREAWEQSYMLLVKVLIWLLHRQQVCTALYKEFHSIHIILLLGVNTVVVLNSY